MKLFLIYIAGVRDKFIGNQKWIVRADTEEEEAFDKVRKGSSVNLFAERLEPIGLDLFADLVSFDKNGVWRIS